MMASPETPRKGSVWQTAKAIGWAFLGVRKNSSFQDDVARLQPLHIVAIGLVAALCFVGVLILLVRWVVATS
jgi:hypothetical protein